MKRALSFFFTMVCIELPAFFLFCLLRPFAFFLIKDKKEGTKPILLVHGYLHSKIAWIYLKPYLARRGFGPLYTIDLNAPFSSIERHSAKVAEKIEEIKRETKASAVVGIGHSMGGLVLSHAALVRKADIEQIITLGSPFYGTYMAYLGLGKSAKEMRIASPFIEALRSSVEGSRSPSFFHIGTLADEIVVPPSSSFPRGHKKFAVSHLGHMTLLTSRQVAKEVVKHLHMVY